MRTLVVSGAMALALVVQAIPTAKAADNPVLRTNNDAGASSTVIRKNEPPVPGVPTPPRRENNDTQQNR